jgi:hypothetical protein
VSSWDGDIDSTPLSRSVPVERGLSDEAVLILGDLAAEQRLEGSTWRAAAIASSELEDIDYAALERMGLEEAAADYARRECEKEVSMRRFRAGGIAANDAGPHVDPALARASALGWTGPATNLNAPIASYRGDLNQPLRDMPQTHADA